jgi:hypothetical protein
MSEFTKKSDSSLIISLCGFDGIEEASNINLPVGGPADSLLVDDYAPSLASSATPMYTLESNLVVGKQLSIFCLLRGCGDTKIALPIIKSSLSVNMICRKALWRFHHLLVHGYANCLSAVVSHANSIVDSALQVRMPFVTTKALIVPNIDNGDLSSSKGNETNRSIRRLLNFMIFQFQASLLVLDYNTNGVEVCHR